MLIVIDASAVVDALLGVRNVEVRIETHELHAPVTIDAEVLHALRRKWLAKLVDERDALLALDAFGAIAITRHTVQPLVARMARTSPRTTPVTSRWPNP
jgi:predicted nucleic acid-binding protein